MAPIALPLTSRSAKRKQNESEPYQKNGKARYRSTVTLGSGTATGCSFFGTANTDGTCARETASTTADATSCGISASSVATRHATKAAAPAVKAIGTRQRSCRTLLMAQLIHKTVSTMYS